MCLGWCMQIYAFEKVPAKVMLQGRILTTRNLKDGKVYISNTGACFGKYVTCLRFLKLQSLTENLFTHTDQEKHKPWEFQARCPIQTWLCCVVVSFFLLNQNSMAVTNLDDLREQWKFQIFFQVRIWIILKYMSERHKSGTTRKH